jgi:hypothetical protein
MPSCAIIIGSSRCVTAKQIQPRQSSRALLACTFFVMQLKRTAGRFSSPRQIQRKSLSFFLVRSTALRCILGRTRCHLRWGSADSCQQCASLSTEIKDSARNRPNNKANQFLFRLLAALGNLACIMKLFGCAIIFRAQRSSPLVFFLSSS